jgi:hypothetical protein
VQGGAILLTVALLLLLVSGILAATVGHLRAGLPGEEIAAAQRLALARADEAILGFASIFHRLPCPAETPNGAENCALAKGYLPGAIALDAMLYTPNTLAMRYMVYRNAATGDLAGNAPITVADGSSRSLPSDKYDPTPEKESSFNARNGLDMCETMRLAYKDRETNPATYAHYRRGSASVSVAYGLALPGAGDKSDNGSLFDGANAGNDPEMEAPDRGHGFSYDDFVFTRDFPSLMSAFGCMPVDYQVYVDRNDPIDGKIVFNNDLFGRIIGEFSPHDDDWQRTDNSTELEVSYDRKGVISPVTASVDAVAFSFSVIEKAESQREDVEKSADSAYTYGIISSTTGTVGNILSTVKLIDNGISIGEAIAKAAACLGLCVNQYVAIGFYVGSIVSEGIALGFAITNTVKTIQSTLKYNEILTRLGGKSDAADGFCEAMKAGDQGMSEAIVEMEKQQEEMKKEVDSQQGRAEEARKRTQDVHQQVSACIAELEKSKGKPPVMVKKENGEEETVVKDRSDEAENYTPFLLDEANENAIFADIAEAEANLSDLDERIKSTDEDIARTDTSRQEVLDEFAAATQEYMEGLAASNASLPENQRLTAEQLEDLRQKNYVGRIKSAEGEYEILQTKKYQLETERAAAVTAAEEARAVLNAAVTGIPDDLREEDFPTCTAVNGKITSSYAAVVYGGNVSECNEALQRNDGFCESNHYYDLWIDYRRQQVLYEEMSAEYEKFAAMVTAQKANPPNNAEGACAVGGFPIQLWPIEEARAILRQVDKRGGLQ